MVANRTKRTMVTWQAIVALIGAPDACAIDRTREEITVGARCTPRVGPKLDVGENAALFAAVEPVGAGKATTA
jgi:hypothetical protein